MGSAVDPDSSHVVTSQSDLGAKMLKAGSVLGTAGTIAGGAVAVYDFLKSLEPDPIQTALEDVKNYLEDLAVKQDLDQLSGILNDKVIPTAALLDKAVNSMTEFNNSDSKPNRDTLSANFGQTGGLHVALLELLSGYQLRFIPAAYQVDGKTPAWIEGRWEMCLSYSSMQYGPSWPIQFYQVYEQANQPLAQFNAVPAALDQKNFGRWDAGLYLPLYQKALDFWAIAMGQLEPFYRLTGQWASHIAKVGSHMDTFGSNWSNSLLSTREMPTKAEIKQNLGFFSEPYSWYSGTGFKRWPMGVLDPITGTEHVNLNWWKNDYKDHPVELWTEDQRMTFLGQRDAQRQKVETDCGLSKFNANRAHVHALLIPPSSSPSMEPHPELLNLWYASSGNIVAKVEQITLLGKAGQAVSGHYARTPVIATAPFSVQSKPAPEGENQPRRAESDVELGYRIRVLPKGGQPLQNPEWTWHLRHHHDDPVSSLYHLPDTSPRPIPNSTSKKFTATADTWETITDGTKRDRRDVKPDSPIAFTMTVTIADTQPLEKMKPPLIQSDIDNRTRRGGLWITVEADKDENHSRSFELQVELTETAAVDPQGNTGKPAAENKKYTSPLTIPVDICRIYVPSDYFDGPQKWLDGLQTDSHELGIHGPEPDPDPFLELSLWRIVLEREPVLLQRYVHRQRAVTGRPELTAQQVLADLDRILSHAGAPAVARATARVPGAERVDAPIRSGTEPRQAG